MNTKSRYLCGLDYLRQPPGELETGFGLAHQIAHQSTSKVLLTVTGKQNLDAIGPRLQAFHHSLSADNLWKIRGRNPDIMVSGDRDQRPYSWTGPILAVFPTPKTLNEIESIRDALAVIVVPWNDSDHIHTWQNTWNPTLIGNAVAKTATNLPSEPAQKALHSLTLRVNLNNGLATYSDREEAINVLNTLLHYDDSPDQESYRAWLVSKEGWPSDVADEAIDILNQLRAGKRLKGIRPPDKSRFDRWNATNMP
ncbi:MAG: hypothetical protein Phyf2KO_08150 [Phycisphaerales bacterium]